MPRTIRSADARSAGRWAVAVAVILAGGIAIAALALPELSADGTAGLLAAGLILLIAGGVAIVVRRATGPHAD